MARSRAELELLVELKDKASRGLDKIADKGGFLSRAFEFATGGLIERGITRISGAVTDMFGTAFGEAMDAQQGMAQLEAVIKSTGGAAGMTAQEVANLSSRLSTEGGLSRATDDAVLAANNMLLTFTNIGKDVFPDTSQAVLDMATAMNNGAAPSLEDLQAKAILVGKALNDPTKGLTALTRVGVTFTAEQKEQIKSLQASGDLMGAQKIILGELAKEFGGSALASTKTFGGQMDILRGQFEKSMQALGEKLMPKVEEFLTFLNSPEGQEVIQTFVDLIGGVLSGAIDLAVGAFNTVMPIVRGFIDLLKTGDVNAFKESLEHLPEPLQNILGFVGDVVVKVQEFIGAVSSGDASKVQKFWDDLGGPIGFIGGLITDAALGVTDFIKGFSGEGSAEANQFWVDLKGNADRFNETITKSQTEGRAFWESVINVQPGETPFEAAVREAGNRTEEFKNRVNEGQIEGQKFWSTVIQINPGETPFEAAIRTANDNLETFKTRVNESQTEGQEFWGSVIQIEPGETPFEAAIRTANDNLNTFKERVNTSQTEGQAFWKTVIEVKEGETPFEAAMNRANEGLVTLANTVSDWGVQMVENFKKGVSSVWTKITTIGGDIIAGIKTGITNAWTGFKDWVVGRFNDLVGAITSWGKGGSPYMLLAEEVGAPLVQGIQAGYSKEWLDTFAPSALGWFDDFKLQMKLQAMFDDAKDPGRELVNSVRLGAEEQCPTVAQKLEDCLVTATTTAEEYASSPAAKTPGQMTAWAIRDGILDEQDQVYSAFQTFWDGLWGIASERARQIQELINNTMTTGSPTGSQHGSWEGGWTPPGNPGGGGGGQVMDRGGIVMTPTPAMLAVNHRPEAVIPLDGARGVMGNTFYVTIQAGPGVNGQQLADEFVDQVYERLGQTGRHSTYSRSWA